MTSFIATASQLISCKAEDAFEAFANPDLITQFWLGSASGPLSEGSVVTWNFMVPGAVDTVTVVKFERPHLIDFTWSDGSMTRLEFSEQSTGKTKVSVAAQVISETDLMEMVVDTTEGFAIALCDLKTFLETGRSANLVRAKAELITSSMATSKSKP